ncbi:hypothetical protein SSX86_027476 [Deinandra increscens subsp. villosa]|uniref:Transposase n=1 Tax=Deinandra increscens subsp. villosa TaxID=3103831 RepID=A0AAP0GP35_9ASTR
MNLTVTPRNSTICQRSLFSRKQRKGPVETVSYPGPTLTLLVMEWYTNRTWMYKMTNSDGFINIEYCDNLNKWLDFVYSNEEVVDKRVTKRGKIVLDIKCPCLKCQNVGYRNREIVKKHLLINGFMPYYTTWHAHGENSTSEVGQSSTTMEVDNDDDSYRRMVLDSMSSFEINAATHSNLDSSTSEGHVPNPEAKGFYDMLKAADEPLWEGEKPTNCSKLEAATGFLNWKSLFNVSNACYDYNISMVKALMPDNNKLPENFYDTKKSLQKLSLPKERIDVCKNHCMLFYKQDKTLTQCKWKLGRLKRMIRNKARVEGSIVESYLIDELSTYCSMYLEPTVKTRLNREPRNFAPNIPCSSSIDSRLSIFKHPSRRLFDKGGQRIVLTDEDRHKAHTYILFNCQELHEAIWSFDEHLRDLFPNYDQETLEKEKEKSFAKWLQLHVINDPKYEHLRDIAQGPLVYVQSHKGYLVNGYKFHTQTAYHGRVTQNCGVCVRGASYNEQESDYYGLLDDILELEYHSNLGSCVVVLFKCTWFDPVKAVRVDPKTKMVDVKPKVIGCVDDPFILASQAQQVYYTPYPSKEKGLKDWWAVVKTTPRGVYELAEDTSEVGDDNNEEEEDFYQENERVVCTVTDDILPITHVQENIVEELDDINDDDPETTTEDIDTNDDDFNILPNFDEEEFEDDE